MSRVSGRILVILPMPCQDSTTRFAEQRNQEQQQQPTSSTPLLPKQPPHLRALPPQPSPPSPPSPAYTPPTTPGSHRPRRLLNHVRPEPPRLLRPRPCSAHSPRQADHVHVRGAVARARARSQPLSGTRGACAAARRRLYISTRARRCPFSTVCVRWVAASSGTRAAPGVDGHSASAKGGCCSCGLKGLVMVVVEKEGLRERWVVWTRGDVSWWVPVFGGGDLEGRLVAPRGC